MPRTYAPPLVNRAIAVLLGAAGLVPLAPRVVAAQTPPRLNENCIVSVLNRNVRVRPDGTWVLPNIPANFGLVRARATCVIDGQTISGESAPFLILANGSIDVPRIVLGATTPIPISLNVSTLTPELGGIGQTAPLRVVATYPLGITRDVTAGSTGTKYTVSNPAIANVTADGLVTALASGTVLIQATHEGTGGFTAIRVVLGGDSDGDGIADDVELSLGLNPNNAADALEDPDRDGLSNRDEAALGTQIRNPDTDNDGIFDGEERRPGADGFVTSPLLADSDGDGVRDALEIATGSDPTSAASTNLRDALKALTVAPAVFHLTVNSIQGVASRQLAVTGHLLDGVSIDLTSTQRGTNYASDDLNVCNFGQPDGRVFGAQAGACTITVTNNGFTAVAMGTVASFTPRALSFVTIPGFANNVDVSGSYAYVAAGASGLQIVDVSNRAVPVIAAAFDTPGNANDVKVVGNLAFIADGVAGLRIIDVSNPTAPVAVGSLDTPGDAWDVAVTSNRAYVADGASGLRIIDVRVPAQPVLLGSIDPAGIQKGVEVDPARQLAVLASGTSGLHIVNVSNPAAPALMGTLSGGDVRDVALQGTFAFLADATRSFTPVDITDPAVPVPGTSTSLSLGGRLNDVVIQGSFALGADVFFVNGVPVVNIDAPSTPVTRAILNFASFRDDDGQGIAADGSYVYLAAVAGSAFVENGTTGNSRLYIGEYLAAEDVAGVPPAAQIVAPTPGSTFIEGAPISVRVTATDDVTVVGVSLTINGLVVSSDTSAPYEFTVAAPPAAQGPYTLGANATDLGGNVGTAAPVLINVIPDPGTLVVGRVVDGNGQGIAGATVTAFQLTALSGPDGTFGIQGVPTTRGAIVVSAEAILDGRRRTGRTGPLEPVPGGQTEAGTIVLRSGGVIGYYDISLNRGAPAQVAPITLAGLTPVDVGNLATADLTQFDVLFVQNPNNGGYSTVFNANLGRLHQFVADGGVLVLHDRFVSGAGSVLPGSPGVFIRDFTDGANINIVDNTTVVTNGPGGVITNSSLDGGNSSNHGYVLASTIPPGARGILSTGDLTHLVTYSYGFGQGKVVYSTIPLDFYLGGSGSAALNQNMRNYAANVVTYANDVR